MQQRILISCENHRSSLGLLTSSFDLLAGLFALFTSLFDLLDSSLDLLAGLFALPTSLFDLLSCSDLLASAVDLFHIPFHFQAN